MAAVSCARCQEPWPEEEMLLDETNGETVCPDCSGLLKDEDLSCRYDELG